MHESINQWLHEWNKHQWINEGRKQEMNGWMNGWMNACMNEWMHACMNVWMNEWKNGWPIPNSSTLRPSGPWWESAPQQRPLHPHSSAGRIGKAIANHCVLGCFGVPYLQRNPIKVFHKTKFCFSNTAPSYQSKHVKTCHFLMAVL